MSPSVPRFSAELASLSPTLRDKVIAHKRAGDHMAAAALLEEEGYAVLAGELYEQLFEHEAAVRAYLTAAEFTGAMRVALRGASSALIEEVVTHAQSEDKTELLIGLLEQAGRFAELGHIFHAKGELQAAAEAYEAGHSLVLAAECRLGLGDFRAAGVLLERHLAKAPRDPEASLRLGQILARFSRHDDAIQHLQQAIASAPSADELLCRAAPTLVICFLQLGYEQAATTVFERWQKAAVTGQAAAPASLEAFLRSDQVAAYAAVASEQRPADEAASPGLPREVAAGEEPLLAVPFSSSTAVDERAPNDLLWLAGRYLLGEPLGGGGLGQVFRAFDAFLDRPVAVKIFGQAALASSSIKAYAAEARAVSSMRNPALVELIELNLPQGYVVTQLVEGTSVEQRLQADDDRGWILPFARSVLSLLQGLHRVGLVHGALKPTNVFWCRDQLQVMDFGSHHLLSLQSTETGGLSSAWPYLAPEQLLGAPPDAGADLYALAAILYRAIMGVVAYGSPDDDRLHLPLLPSARLATADIAWDRFFEVAFSAERARRFSSAEEMMAALPRDVVALPVASSSAPDGAAPLSLSSNETERYVQGDLVFREPGRAKVYEGEDRTVDRAVWVMELANDDDVQLMARCAQLGRGIQPVYDVLPDVRRVILARDREQRRADLQQLASVPHALVRDLVSVARALEQLHAFGAAFGGFEISRALGPVGPRLRLAPAHLPHRNAPERFALDWESFETLVLHGFGCSRQSAVGARDRFWTTMVEQRLLPATPPPALSAELAALSWSSFLQVVETELHRAASARWLAQFSARLAAEARSTQGEASADTPQRSSSPPEHT